MNLPTSRESTAGAGGAVPSGTINAIQDSIIGMKQPAHWRWQGIPLVAPANVANLNTQRVSAGADGASSIVHFTLDAIVGSRIIGIAFNGLGTAFAGSHMKLTLWRDAGTAAALVQIDQIDIAVPVAVWTLYTHVIAAPETIVQGYSYEWAIQLDKAGMAMAGIGAQFDRL